MCKAVRKAVPSRTRTAHWGGGCGGLLSAKKEGAALATGVDADETRPRNHGDPLMNKRSIHW